MARNPIPEPFDRLSTLAEDMIDGLTSIGPATGVVQNTASVLQAALDSASAAETDFQKSRKAKTVATAGQTVADSNAKAFIATAKRILVPRLGPAWSTAWSEVGFVNGSIETPRAIDERFSLLSSLRDYFTDHPDHENAPLGISSAAAGTLHTAFKAARALLQTALTTLGTARDTRETKIAALRTRMRGLIDELDVLLPDDDPRWYTLGLSAPGDPETPGIPEAPTLTPGAPASAILFLDWPDTRRADRYRVWLKKPGEAGFTPVATTTESETTLTQLPLGIPLELQITALNQAGESISGPVAAVTLN